MKTLPYLPVRLALLLSLLLVAPAPTLGAGWFWQAEQATNESLYIACENGHTEVVQKLLADDRIDPSKPDRNGFSPFSIACENGHTEVVQKLLADDRIDPSKPNRNGSSPFCIACQQGHAQVVQLLLADDRIDPSKPNRNGFSPFYIACERGISQVVQLLLADRRVDPNQPDKKGFLPLYIACQSGQEQIVQLLLDDYRVDPNIVPRRGYPVLNFAYKIGQRGSLLLLLANSKVDFDAKNKLGETFRQVLQEKGEEALLMRLDYYEDKRHQGRWQNIPNEYDNVDDINETETVITTLTERFARENRQQRMDEELRDMSEFQVSPPPPSSPNSRRARIDDELDIALFSSQRAFREQREAADTALAQHSPEDDDYVQHISTHKTAREDAERVLHARFEASYEKRNARLRELEIREVGSLPSEPVTDHPLVAVQDEPMARAKSEPPPLQTRTSYREQLLVRKPSRELKPRPSREEVGKGVDENEQLYVAVGFTTIAIVVGVPTYIMYKIVKALFSTPPPTPKEVVEEASDEEEQPASWVDGWRLLHYIKCFWGD